MTPPPKKKRTRSGEKLSKSLYAFLLVTVLRQWRQGKDEEDNVGCILPLEDVHSGANTPHTDVGYILLLEDVNSGPHIPYTIFVTLRNSINL